MALYASTGFRGALDSQSREGYKHGMGLNGKVAVVTGASMGIGEQIARIFADNGAKVVLLSRDSSRVEAARHRVGHTDRTLALACDVRKHEDLKRTVMMTLRHFDRLDIWVNNAGHGLLDSLANADIAAIRETFETNLFGAIDAMQVVVPVMKEQGGGTIINISSVAGHIPLPFHAVYSSTKFALNAIGKAARIELKASGINVLTVCPGYVRTDFGANAIRGAEQKQVRPSSVRGITPERVARSVLRGYMAQKREIVVPWFMHFPIKLYQLFPGFMEMAMARMLRQRE